jgi:Na+-translocating ferredoxin:NAD+ oxidoreductase subunit C
MLLKTFRLGGIHPKSNKLASSQSTTVLGLPEVVKVPLVCHIGAPSVLVVNPGDKVKVGQLIGQASGHVSANVHSSVSGTVLKIDNIVDVSGREQSAVFIRVEGDEWDEKIDRTPDVISSCDLEIPHILNKIANAGIVGLGGATFPTHVKLSLPPGKKAEILLINGIECEPYLTCDHRLMLERGEQILVGVSILMKVLGVKRAIIGVERNKKDAIENLKKFVKSFNGIEIAVLKNKYPQGGEKQLIEALTDKQVPCGGLPIDVGCVVQNVATANAVYEAVQKNKPLIERIITVTGKSVKSHGNYWVRIGVPLSFVAEQTGGVPEDTGKIIVGGPMMGKALSSLDGVASKGTGGLLYIQNADAIADAERNCIRCTKCIVDCPMGLEPFLLKNEADMSLWDEMDQSKVMDCIECGCCDYSCPSNKPLLTAIRQGKQEVGKIIRERNTNK